MNIIAKTFAGLEELLAKELETIGAQDIEQGIRMVSFTGDKETLYRANFCLRTAVKVLMPIHEFQASDADEVYSEVRKINWEQYMDVDSTFVVDAVVFSEAFRHSRFAAYRVKDAIADYFREKTGKRPNVGISNPDLRINLHIAETTVTISLDSSGDSLHLRGYRTGTVAAPLNEVLAAGMILLTGWDGQTDFIDPMCGSGTILIEAALIARNIYPGVFRKEFAFERWKDFDPELFDRIYNDDSQEREFHHKIYGYDINHHAVAIATENAKAAGVADIVEIRQQDVRDLEQPAEPAIMVTNPPYGERITTDDILSLYSDIGRTLKHSFVGNDAWILSYREECFQSIGMRPSTRIVLYNGALECEFRRYQVFGGKLSDRREEGLEIKTEEDLERNLKFRKKRAVEPSADGEDRPQDEEPRLNRHNFKWGDRGADYRPDNDDHYFKSRPFEKKPYERRPKDDSDRQHEGEDRPRSYDRKPREGESRGRSYDRKPWEGESRGRSYDRKPWEGESRERSYERKPREGESRGRSYDRKPWEGESRGRSYDRKPREDARRGKGFGAKGDERGAKPKLRFDSEGRPIK